MGVIKEHQPALRMLIAFSRHLEALEWARKQGESAWGPVAATSPVFAFADTHYYDATMGGDLRKQLIAFQQLMSPEELVHDKRMTNDWEEAYQRDSSFPEDRPLNLDPGYLTQAKLVLATTKDRDHRIYLGQGIYAEVTLHYHGGEWRSRPWTYPDFGNGQYFEFLTQARQVLRRTRR